MALVSNDPGLSPIINFYLFSSYWMVAAGAVVVYDWVLTLGQEIELIWRQRWSLPTVLYLAIRYIGIPYSVISVLESMSFISMADAGCNIIIYALNGTNVVIAAMLGVIMIARLHAMYQGSRKMLIFLIIIFLIVNIACGVITAIGFKYLVGEGLILSGVHICNRALEADVQFLFTMGWTFTTVWEVLALCLSIWIAVKYFRDLQRLRPSTGLTVGACFRVLIKSHVLYFSSFVGVSCLGLLGGFSSGIFESNSTRSYAYSGGVLQIFTVMQLFVLGPRLILSVREYHAKLVADTDTETSMASIVFQERVHVPTSSTV